MDIFALTTRGLEAISADELSALPGTQVVTMAYRRVEADFSGDVSRLLDLKTVDDVFLHLATWQPVTHTRDMLPRFSDWCHGLDLAFGLDVLAQFHNFPPQPTYAITVNYVGKRNYSTLEVKAVLAETIPPGSYVENDRDADLNLRVFIEHDVALVGLRIGQSPLHRRPYKQFHMLGALKPTVAHAMIGMAGGRSLVDPFCGSGTIAIEATQAGITSYGGDINQDTLVGALENNRATDKQISFLHWDAQQLPLSDASIDCVVSNLPWGRQVQVDTALATLYQQAFAEMQRIVVPGGKIVLLTTFPELIGKQPDSLFEISLFGQNPKIMNFEKSRP